MPYLMSTREHSAAKYQTQILCALVFWMFSLAYLFFYQADVLAAGQHVLSGGQTRYNRYVGAFLITLMLYLLQLGVAQLTQLKKRAHAVTYFPSLLVLTFITDVSPHIEEGFSLGGWMIAIPLLALVYAALVWALRQIEPYEPVPLSNGLFSRTQWINLLTMVLMFVAVGLFSNDDEVFHYRMRMEKLIAEEKYDEALKVGRRSLATDATLTMLRAHALEKKKQLGDHFFDYPVSGDVKKMLPDTIHPHVIILPDSVVTDLAKTPRARIDYRLMSLLLERDLETFSLIVQRVYADSVMPKHFAEALLQYRYYSGKPLDPSTDDVIATDFNDFRKMEKAYPPEQAANYLRRTFRNTYWYYYKYGEK